MNTPETTTIGGVSLAWIDGLATDLRKKGLAFRAGSDAPTIEIQNIHTGRFERLTLEGRRAGDCDFPSRLARALVLERLRDHHRLTESCHPIKGSRALLV